MLDEPTLLSRRITLGGADRPSLEPMLARNLSFDEERTHPAASANPQSPLD